MKRASLGDRIISVTFYVILTLLSIICLYPIWYVVVASISDSTYVNSGAFIILPRGIHWDAYQYAFVQPQLWVGYRNTIIYTLLGTLIGLGICLPAGYALSRKDLPYRGVLMALLVFTMYFTTDTTESFSEKYFVKDSEAACNVKITWVELLDGQHSEPLAAMLAGNLPDIFMLSGKISDSVILQNASLWQSLTVDEIKQYCPNVYVLYEKYVDNWEAYLTFPDGNIYSLMGDFLNSNLHTIPHTQYINTKWLENLGLEMPTTLEEPHSVLVAFKEQDANGNGDPTTKSPSLSAITMPKAS